MASQPIDGSGRSPASTSLARETLGGNGILIDNHIARLWTDAEVIYTYEGSNEINLLIVGRDLTGENAIV